MDILPHISILAPARVIYGVLNMSMPSFPPNGADMSREEALTMIIASIAMEELALSHILNAEGEKLQFILGTLPGAGSCACPQDVLAVNKSVTALVEAVSQNQMLLKNKLDRVLEFCPFPPVCGPESCPPQHPSPCPPPCTAPCPPSHPVPCKAPPCEKSALHLTVQRERMLWNQECRLPWRLQNRTGTDVCWDPRTPAQIQLIPSRIYMVQYTLNVCAKSPAEGTGTILLRQSPCGAFADVSPLCFSVEHLTHGPQTLQHIAVLHPRVGCGWEASLSLVLGSKTPLCVEQAAMDVIAL